MSRAVAIVLLIFLVADHAFGQVVRERVTGAFRDKTSKFEVSAVCVSGGMARVRIFAINRVMRSVAFSRAAVEAKWWADSADSFLSHPPAINAGETATDYSDKFGVGRDATMQLIRESKTGSTLITVDIEDGNGVGKVFVSLKPGQSRAVIAAMRRAEAAANTMDCK